MKKYLVVVLFSLSYFSAISQKALSEQDDFIKGKSLYLNYDSIGNQLNYFTKNNFDDQEPFTKKHQLSLKHTFSRIYLNWLNPLKYKITWKDSIYTDDRDFAINNFISLLVGQFGSGLTRMNKEIEDKSITVSDDSINKTKLASPVTGTFNSFEILELYRHIQHDIRTTHKITEPELVNINSLLTELFKLDAESTLNIPDSVEISFINLYTINSFKAVNDVCSKEKKRLNAIDNRTSIKDLQVKIADLVKKINVAKDQLLASYIRKSVLFISDKLSKESDKNKILLSNLNSIIETVEKSVKPTQSNIQEGFFFVRNVKFDAGKILETDITISEYEYNKDKKEFSKKSDAYQSTIKFRKFDWVVPVVSAGVFYSDATLKGFGVSTDNSGALIVSEDNIDKNTAVTALFLNLNFDMGSRYIAPAIQLGIDPTKLRPYVLLGGGLSFPAAQLSLTGGWIWTSDAYLDGLQVGQGIKSTTDLDKATKYKFDAKTKGWYVGIQYNF